MSLLVGSHQLYVLFLLTYCFDHSTPLSTTLGEELVVEFSKAYNTSVIWYGINIWKVYHISETGHQLLLQADIFDILDFNLNKVLYDRYLT